MDMDRIEKIRCHPLYREQYRLLQTAEADRIFCRHTLEHFLDVARLMVIYNLEEGTGLSKEHLYATALLHDIGRYEELTQGTPHHEASAKLAGLILKDCSFSSPEIAAIQGAIRHHRDADGTDTPLSQYLYRADKTSRCCFACPAIKDCNWPDSKKNLTLTL